MLRVVFVTAPVKDAEQLARPLLEERLVACVNIIPKVGSLYWWQGRIERGEEALLVMKTSEALVERLIERVKALHAYEVPEVIALAVEAGNQAYIEWALGEATGRPE